MVAANPSIPRYGGSDLPSAVATLAALFGLIVIMGSAAAWSSGWRPSFGRASPASSDLPSP